MSEQTKSNKIQCCSCETEYVISNYYATKSPFFPSGRIPVCKKCIFRIIEEDENNFVKLLQLIDKPLWRDDYESAKNKQEYIKNVQSLTKYRDATFVQSDSLQAVRATDIKIENEKGEGILTKEELEESRFLWGENLSEREYAWLNNELALHLEENPKIESQKILQEIVMDICRARLEKRNKEADLQDTSKISKTIDQLYESAKLKPKQQADIGESGQTLGTIVEGWERKKHVPELKDKDGLEDVVQTWFLGGVARMMGKISPLQSKFDKAIKKYGYNPDGDKDG